MTVNEEVDKNQTHQHHQQQTLVPVQQNKTLHNRIHVSVRVKPLAAHEKIFDRNKQWQILNEKQVQHSVSKETYTFDKVFNESMSTSDIFQGEAKSLVLSALDGYNVTIFAYGQTASGKTHTMRGNESQQGIIPLALQDIFTELQAHYGNSTMLSQDDNHTSEEFVHKSWIVKVSYLEIYNECVNDLLDQSRKNLSVRENQSGKPFIDNLSEYEVSSIEETMYLLNKGDEQRKIAETKQNEKSSRSHTVFKITLIMSERHTQIGRNTIKTSQINLVDLAGSEGVSKTQSDGMRFREGSNINKSLLALSRVIQMLGQKFQNGASKGYYINFRDSKLTRILQQALSGNSMTSIICTMSQLFTNYSESRETMNFGAKAKNIKTIVNLNEIVKESPEEIALKMQKLSRENEELKLKLLNQEEVLVAFEKDKEEFASLGNMKSHQNYLMSLLNEKNEELQRKDERLLDVDGRLADLLQQHGAIMNHNQELQSKLDLLNIAYSASHRLSEELELTNSQLEAKLQVLSDQLQSYLNPCRLNSENLNNQTMECVHDIKQKSKLNISDTSLISNDGADPLNRSELLKLNLQSDVLILMSENEKLKSTINILNDKKDDYEMQIATLANQNADIKDTLNQEKNNNLRLMQQIRVMRIESKKKDKIISKKNFQMQGLLEKIEVLEKSNASLFKDLDNTIYECSVIQNQSVVHMGDEQSEPNSRASLVEQIGEPIEQGLTANLLQAHHRAQLLELQTKVEILQSEKNNLEQEKILLQSDLEEAERNVDNLANELKEQNYEVMEQMDINEDLELNYDDLRSQQEKDQMVIQNQRQCIEQQNAHIYKVENTKLQMQQEMEVMKKNMLQMENKLKEVEEQYQRLKDNSRKRKYQEMAATGIDTIATEGEIKQDCKKFRLNDGTVRTKLPEVIDQELVDEMKFGQHLTQKVMEQIKHLKDQHIMPLVNHFTGGGENKENQAKIKSVGFVAQKLQPEMARGSFVERLTPIGNKGRTSEMMNIQMRHQFNLGRAEKFEELNASGRSNRSSLNNSCVSNFKQ